MEDINAELIAELREAESQGEIKVRLVWMAKTVEPRAYNQKCVIVIDKESSKYIILRLWWVFWRAKLGPILYKLLPLSGLRSREIGGSSVHEMRTLTLCGRINETKFLDVKMATINQLVRKPRKSK